MIIKSNSWCFHKGPCGECGSHKLDDLLEMSSIGVKQWLDSTGGVSSSHRHYGALQWCILFGSFDIYPVKLLYPLVQDLELHIEKDLLMTGNIA